MAPAPLGGPTEEDGLVSKHTETNPLRTLAGVAVAAAFTSMLAGCYAPPHERIGRTTTVVEAAAPITLRPPAPRSELIPPAPNERVVWDPGRWNWNGQGYVWISGHYVERPYQQAKWEPGHWVAQDGAWAWEQGHWRG